MSFIKEEFTAIECDNCKEFYENTDGVSFFVDENSAKEEATNWGEFIEHEGNHYCSECAKTDDDDKLIIDASRTKAKCNVCNQFLDIDNECPTGHRQT